jgi:hypothetical protein
MQNSGNSAGLRRGGSRSNDAGCETDGSPYLVGGPCSGRARCQAGPNSPRPAPGYYAGGPSRLGVRVDRWSRIGAVALCASCAGPPRAQKQLARQQQMKLLLSQALRYPLQVN